jgi:hypothetical protein
MCNENTISYKRVGRWSQMRITVLSCHSGAWPFDPTSNKKTSTQRKMYFKKASEPSTFAVANSVTKNFRYIAEINL